MSRTFSLMRLSLLFVLALSFAPEAQAYFSGSTPTDGVELKDGPSADARTVRVLPSGTSFNAADTPNNGYYRVRTASDSGWVSGVSIGKDGGQSADPFAAENAQPQPQAKSKKRSNGKQRRKSSEHSNYFVVKLVGDLNFASTSDINNAIGSNSFSSEPTIGGEILYYIDPAWGLGLRIEHFSKSVSGTDNQSPAHSLTYSLSSTPIMLGVEHPFSTASGSGFYLNGSAFLGLASTTFTGSDSTAGTSGSTGGSAVTFLALLEGGYQFSQSFAAFGELGYRVLNKSAGTVTGTLPNGITSLGINLSGPVLGLGVKLSI